MLAVGCKFIVSRFGYVLLSTSKKDLIVCCVSLCVKSNNFLSQVKLFPKIGRLAREIREEKRGP